ncbi:MAG: SRPBCC family protein [Bacteroidetes bacterium]|nr:SRPBCC family protein [Bacteroidota bacterium]
MIRKGKENENRISIVVETLINAPADKLWELWTEPEHITKWNNASDDWHTPRAENDLRAGGKFLWRMEARDGSAGFDFEGTYTNVKPNERIEYVLADGRKVKIEFNQEGNKCRITETFDAENSNPAEMQKKGWQSILDNFKKYAEKSV